jgi:hypothetical protein
MFFDTGPLVLSPFIFWGQCPSDDFMISTGINGRGLPGSQA